MTYGETDAPPAATAMTVRLDDDGRVLGVTLSRLADEDRESSRLDAAFQAAMTRALADQRPTADVLDEEGRPRAARVVLPTRPSLRELLEASIGTPRGPREHVPSGVPVGGERGVSANSCVSVVLDSSGPRGRLQFDSGWLRQATPTNIAAGIQQAFHAAYDTRGRR